MGRPAAIRHDSEEERVIGWKADLVAKVLAAVSAVSFSIFVLALMAVTDPVTATILGEFRPHTCVITQSYFHRGSTLCKNWSSCKNLCADPPVLYSCFHVVVRVYPLNQTMLPEQTVRPPEVNVTPLSAQLRVEENQTLWSDEFDVETLDPSMSPEMSARLELFPPSLEIFGYRIYGNPAKKNSSEKLLEQGLPVRFYVNAAGCGYDLNCSEFQLRFEEVGYSFPCLYSQLLNRSMPLDVPTYSDPWVTSLVTPAVPAVISMASLAYLCIKGHCDMPRLMPRHVLIRMLRRRRTKIWKQLNLMQKRGSIRSVRSNMSLKSIKSTAPNTPQSVEWKKRPLPDIKVIDGTKKKLENDLVVQLV